MAKRLLLGLASQHPPPLAPANTKSDSVVALYVANPGGRSSSEEFATAAVAAMLDVPLVLDQTGPVSSADSSSEDSASSDSDSDMPLHIANSRGRASPTDSTTVAALARFVPLALDHEDPSLRKNFASSDPDVPLYFSNRGGRASPTGFTTAATSALLQKTLRVQRAALAH